MLLNKTTLPKYDFCGVLFSKPVLPLQMPELPDSRANQQTKFHPMLQEGAAQRCSDALTSSNALLPALRVYFNGAAVGAKFWDLGISPSF